MFFRSLLLEIFVIKIMELQNQNLEHMVLACFLLWLFVIFVYLLKFKILGCLMIVMYLHCNMVI